MAEKIEERSRASVCSIPASTSAAISESQSRSTPFASERSWRSVQRSTSAIGRSVRLAACSSGASSAAARSVQWPSFVVPLPGRVQAAIALAITRASSQLRPPPPATSTAAAPPSGSRRSEAVGSNSQAWPTSERAATVARITSGLVAVLITAPDAPITAGIITALVFPERGGPRTITALSGSARAQLPLRPRPR